MAPADHWQGRRAGWEEAVKEVIGRDFQLSKISYCWLDRLPNRGPPFELLSVGVDDDTIRRMVRAMKNCSPRFLSRRATCCRTSARSWSCWPSGMMFVRICSPATRRREGEADALRLVRHTSRRRLCRGYERSFCHCHARARTGPTPAPSTTRRCSWSATPHDIECANAIGARTVAVATGGYSLDERIPSSLACVLEAAFRRRIRQIDR